ncbi:MAG: membrane-bound O-acyltransferase family protein [Crocinitomicaceae bacterium]|nr:membrane-bound O-acyltransferase family protein [Crocinitomicaceae bacterium]|tara:strand:- start:13431 stop:15176 length:1746 start_codon:yes stop_codon:yes gene_type:complete
MLEKITDFINGLFSIENIGNLFLYNNDTPLLFTQLYFWVFFAIVLSVYSIVYKKNKVRNGFLFLVSLFFYYKTSGFFFSILLFSTFSDYLLGFAIYNEKNKTTKKWWLSLSIIINLSVLFYFKYAYFFADSFNQLVGTDWHPINHFASLSNQLFSTTFRVDQILLPVGISFFTFQTMSYSIDVYRNAVKPVKSIVDFGFYVSFFPQLVAGPIVRAANFIPQLYKPYCLTKKQFGIAMFWIMNGLLKKVILADYIALNLVDRVFDNPELFSGVENLIALYGYSLQVYADFSGYTDIAIGIALLLGFQLPKNFDSPYKADSCGNFWKRWHISLSSWLKDYLYIPMGGNRGGSVFTFVSLGFVALFLFFISGSFYVLFYFLAGLIVALLIGLVFPKLRSWYITNINIMITMLLGGLWHGASWNFVFWGGLNGLGIVVYKLWRKVSPWENKSKWWNRAWAVFITFNFISFTRIWFRSGSASSFDSMNKAHDIQAELITANSMLYKLLTDLNWSIIPDLISGYWQVLLVMFAGFVIHLFPSKWKHWYRNKFASAPLVSQLCFCVFAVILLYQILSADLQPFIYFQF